MHDYLVYLLSAFLIGTIATVVMDVWSLVRKPLLAMPLPDYGLVGRWLLYMPRGRFRHDAIAASAPIAGERVIGWIAHYLIGVGFAAVLLFFWGLEWVRHPAMIPALVVGIVSVVAPFLLMQPGMGAGIAASRTPRPGKARINSLITHTVFGLGLYVAGWMTKCLDMMQWLPD